ncbi:winged helix-turn-helix domain-containing protein [Streptomyces botrytidirepellens]|uniref:Winged helix family transcriptional regulator n=1 Tax=Streptomyces botrytidirepellens TaxID=2486417 RepID=A0A3M8TNB6_9ACTN|nr:winged helix-turn-helix domain-containing protein [Streptomyces botrytidirepellens]RNF94897.1 winged helix family transcriptional regulator [Streptomyces botrytidirepellens]
MTNVRTLSAPASTSPAATAPGRPPLTGRQRLRAVARDEVPPVDDLLHPGATWLPAPPHTVPALPGQPPMIGYLVLVPADQQERQGTAPAAPATPPAPATPLPTDEGPVRIDPEQRTVRVAGRPLDLTYLEFELLAHLVAHPHRVHTRDQLVTTVWGYGHVGDGRTVDVHVARLRRKLGAEHRGSIVTVRRVGYKYVPTA